MSLSTTVDQAKVYSMNSKEEMKMMRAGAIVGPIERSSSQKQPAPGGPITPVHDLNVPYQGTEEFETPTADMLFPPTPLQAPLPTPLPGSADGSMYNIPTGGSDYPTPVNDSVSNADVKGGRPSPYILMWKCGMRWTEEPQINPTQDFFMMPPAKRKREDFVTQYNNGASGGYIPQRDGAGDAISEVAKTEVSFSFACNFLGRHNSATNAKGKILAHLATSSSKIPQLDGPIPDPYDDMLSTPNIYNYQGVVNEDYNVANTPAPNDLQAATPALVAQNETVDDDDDEPLNEDDDDDDLDDIDQEELNTQHLVLAQFDKVTRTKSRWKCTLKDGIMHINNKDILFNKVTGEFDF